QLALEPGRVRPLRRLPIDDPTRRPPDLPVRRRAFLVAVLHATIDVIAALRIARDLCPRVQPAEVFAQRGGRALGDGGAADDVEPAPVRVVEPELTVDPAPGPRALRLRVAGALE